MIDIATTDAKIASYKSCNHLCHLHKFSVMIEGFAEVG